MKKLLLAIAAMAALSFAVAQATVDMSDRTIADILDSTDQVSILNAMVEFAGLDETLAEDGPFTVFAPIDRAWTGLSTATINGLIRDPETLQSVLLHHVASGQVTSDRIFTLLLTDARQRIGDDTTAGMGVDEPVEALEEADDRDGEVPLAEQQIGDEGTGNMEITDPVEALLATGVTSAFTLESVQGSTLELSSTPTTDTTFDGGRQIGEGDELMGISAPVAALRTGGSDLRVNNANVVSVDIVASNGVIHLIDSILVPADMQLPR